MIFTTSYWKQLFKQFQCTGSFAHAKPYGSGHINDTFLITTDCEIHKNYTFRRINTHVFKNPSALMKNIDTVTKHIQKKQLQEKNQQYTCLEIIKTIDNNLLLEDEHGTWACLLYIDGITHDQLSTPKQAKQAGLAFGNFLNEVHDIDPTMLTESITNFHNVEHRYKQCKQALANASNTLTHNIQTQIDFIESNISSMQNLQLLVESQQIPKHIIHYDPKCNNVLFNKNDQAICVIDLDTVMPGIVQYDFSDAIRTSATMHLEDEPDIDKVKINLATLKSFCAGFIPEVSPWLTTNEKNSLAPFISYNTYLMALRFLTDHLNGNIYFKTQYLEQNLVRANNQIKFMQLLDQHANEINDIIESLLCNQPV